MKALSTQIQQSQKLLLIALFGLVGGTVLRAGPITPSPIEPIHAPFPMPQLQRPAFPGREFNITNFDAVGDGVTLNVRNIQRAVDACHAAGGGTVVVPAGRWLTTPIELKSHVRLHLEDGAEVIFTDEKKYYYAGLGDFTEPPRVVSQSYAPELVDLRFPRPLLSAYDCENIAVTGSGRLDGQGLYWWPVHKNWLAHLDWEYPPDAVARALKGLDPALDYIRPSLIQFGGCRNVLLEGFTAVDSPFWTINPVDCENLIARKLTVRATDPAPRGHAPNTDGINPESCRNVLIEDCDIDTGDDSVAVKSGVNEAGRKRGLPCENIVIRNIRSRRLAVGSEMSGGIRNVFIHDCRLSGMSSILAVKTRRGRGGVIENIYMQDIDVGTVQNDVLGVTMEYWTHVVPAPPEPVSERTPCVRNLFFKNIRCIESSPKAWAFSFNGLPEMPMENIHLENFQLDTGRGIVLRNLRGVLLKDITLTTSIGPEITITNCQDVSFSGLTVPATIAPLLELKGRDSRAIQFDATLEDRRDEIVFTDGAPSDAVRFTTP